MSGGKIVVVSAKGCGPCDEIKPVLKGKVEIIEYFERPEEAQKLLDKVGSEAVPTAIEVDGDRCRKCQISIEENEVRIQCRDETKVFKK